MTDKQIRELFASIVRDVVTDKRFPSDRTNRDRLKTIRQIAQEVLSKCGIGRGYLAEA